MIADPRLAPVTWQAAAPARKLQRRAALLSVAALLFGLRYFTWLLRPERVGNPFLFVVLVIAELFNFGQAVGFWLTCRRRTRPATLPPPIGRLVDVDVFIPVYNEPVEVVEATVDAARRMRGARVHVAVLDDGDSPAMRDMARRLGIRYVQRAEHSGAKAGNINHALTVTDSAFVAVFDCDHVPDAAFLEETLGHFGERQVAFVQTPQYYANNERGGVTQAAWAQQALFFGAIARGKATADSMFCCGTNVVFRREALELVGGFPEGSLTEDFQLSVRLHEIGWRSVYVPKVLARGLGPEDLASYVSQQHRWARGCLSSIPSIVQAELPRRQKAQYLLSAFYFLTGWTVLVYLSLPVIRITTGSQPIAGATADQFLLHFAPYFALSLAALAAVGTGTYTYAAFSLAFSTFWIHIHASLRALLRRPGSFVVTPKHGQRGIQLRPAAPTLVAAGVLVAVAILGLTRDRSPATLNNVAFAAAHVTVLIHGIRSALTPSRSVAVEPAETAPQAA
jgi:cellulose synthase/poly-beta-1,6-N-acetylglucosamine synthase-like glycosyltransferase